MADGKDLTKVTTPQFRASHVHVWKPHAMKGTTNKPKYSIEMLFPKTTDMTTILQAIKQAKIDKFGAKENWPSKESLKSPIIDGDGPKYKDKPDYHDHWIIRAAANENSKPGVYNESVKQITVETEFYSGCYACAYINAFVWEFPKGSGKYGVSFGLNHVQKLGDGKRFGGRKAAEEVFTPMSAASANEMDEDDDLEESFL